MSLSVWHKNDDIMARGPHVSPWITPLIYKEWAPVVYNKYTKKALPPNEGVDIYSGNKNDVMHDWRFLEWLPFSKEGIQI